MKIVILANPDSVHTRRWVTALCKAGVNIVLVGFQDFDTAYYKDLPAFKKYSLGFDAKLNAVDDKLSKLKYFTAVKKIKRILAEEKPDILHSYYASSYGLLGALCNYHPYVISVWGSDIFDFPKSSFIAKWIIKYNLRKADFVLSTSHAMAEETRKYCTKQIKVIPFGVDTEVFYKKLSKPIFDEKDIVIGSIKTLEKVYGIEYLIRAFALVCKKDFGTPLKLLLVGSGSCETEYKELTKELGIEKNVMFAGYVSHAEIVDYYNNIDIFVVSSLSESFGVSVLEASACEVPVIASNVGGLPEVVADKQTGFLVPKQNPEVIAGALEKLISDKALRQAFGSNGRKMVEEKYMWQRNVDEMVSTYNEIIKNKAKQ